jgi:hypothetical protein
MPRVTARPKLDSFNFRVDGDLKRAFLDVADSEDRPAGSILRDFMRSYVADKERGSRDPATAPSATPQQSVDVGSTRRDRRHEQS